MFAEVNSLAVVPDRVQIYLAASPLEAHALANYLGENAVEAFVDGDSLDPLQGAIPLYCTRPTVLVERADTDRAGELIDQWETRCAERRPQDRVGPLQIGMRTVLTNITLLGVIFAIARQTSGPDYRNVLPTMAHLGFMLLFGNWIVIAYRRQKRAASDNAA